MSETDRREFLKRTGAGLAGLTLFAASTSRADADTPDGAPYTIAKPRGFPSPHRSIVLQGLHGYPSAESVRAGERVAFHISSSVPYRLSIARLGRDIDSPSGDEVVHRFAEAPANVQPISPGSFVHVPKALDASTRLEGFSVECWVRPFRLDAWQGLVTQHDAPSATGFGLFVAPDGSVAFILGTEPGAEEAHELRGGSLAAQTWHHVVGTWDGSRKRLYVDGEEVASAPITGAPRLGRAALRLGAAGDRGATSRLLDGDLARPSLRSRALSAEEVASSHEARGLGDAKGDDLLAAWRLDEESGDTIRDASPQGRHGRILNHATWMIGGPSFAPDVPRFGDYDPKTDERRGHGLRFASDDLPDCLWSATHTFDVPEGARSGYWVARAEYELDGEPRTYHMSFVVRRAADAPRAPVVLVAATNTWRAYNAASFCRNPPGLRHVAGTNGLANSPGDPPAYSFYRGHAAGQGTYWVGTKVPWPIAGPYVRYGDLSDYSHLLRAERYTQVWLEEEGYDYEVVTDQDVHRDADVFEGRRAVVLAGHSEYWSLPALRSLERWLAGGGGLVCLSGNSLFWRVSFDDDLGVLECRKADAPGLQVPPSRRGEAWHAQDGRRGGLLAACGFPGWKLVGLTTLGWNNHGDPSHFTPFIVKDASHALFEGPERVDVENGAPIGQAPDGAMPRANGHEVDVRPSTSRTILGGPIPEGAEHPEDPPGIELLAACEGWPKHATSLDYYMRGVSPDRPIGGEIIWWERPDGGRVLNAGAIAAGATLAVDPRMAKLVRNALSEFGVTRDA